MLTMPPSSSYPCAVVVPSYEVVMMDTFLEQVLLVLLGGFIGWAGTVLALPVITPKPIASLLKQLFKIPAFKPPRDWDAIEESVSTVSNLDYGDGGMTFDIHYPVNGSLTDYPVVVWVHGGGFVGGSKEDTTGYCMCIASRGYTVVNMDYGLAPRYRHPRQVLDVDAVLVRLGGLPASIRPDLKRGLFLAGDSAGAHIVSEYAALYSNKDYRDKLGVRLSAEVMITGCILQCGLYDLSAFLNGSWWRHPIRFMTKQIGWAVTGNRRWHSSLQTKRMDVVEYVNSGYPPAFLMDGNYYTFDNQLACIDDRLSTLGIDHEVLSFPRSAGYPRLFHEFQFNLRKPESVFVFDRMVAFMDRLAGRDASAR